MDIQAIRDNFPVTRECVYLDNASLSPLPGPVVEAVTAMLEQQAVRGVAAFWDWVEVTNQAKALIAELIHADPDEIALTQNTSEGINIVAHGLAWRPGDNVVLNDLEFFPNYWPWLRLRALGVEVRVVPHRAGLITVEDYAAHVDGRTRVIAVSSVAWINGLKHDLVGLAELAHAHGGYLAVDAIQSVGVSRVDVRQGPIDFLACGGHKWLFGLLGSGFFFCRKALLEQLEPVYLGWQSDAERFDYTFREYQLAATAQRFNHGNTSVAGHHAMCAGINFIKQIGFAEVEARSRALADYLVDQLVPLGVRFLSPLEARYRSSIINFLPGAPETLLQTARDRGIVVCQRGGGIRVSPSFYNLESEIDQLVEIVRQQLA